MPWMGEAEAGASKRPAWSRLIAGPKRSFGRRAMLTAC
jgi:hypothetical protein